MSTVDALPSPADHVRLVKKIAFRVRARLAAAGARSIPESADIEQELWVAWTIARAKFDSSRGVPFTAYFVRGAWNHINAWARSIEEEIQNVGRSLDEEQRGVGAGDPHARERQLHEALPDERVMPADESVAIEERRSRVFARLSPVARKFLELLDNPPKELYQELDALQARSQWARSRGHYSMAPGRITTAIVADLMGLSAAARYRVYAELKKVSSSSLKVNQC